MLSSLTPQAQRNLQAQRLSGAVQQSTAPPSVFGQDRVELSSPVLPALTSQGFLPPGLHRCNWDDLVARFGQGTRRQELLKPMQQILQLAAQHGADFVYLGGSFVTSKPEPGDFDMTWRVSGQRLKELETEAPLLVDRKLQKETLGGELMATYPNSPGDGVLGFLQKTRSGRPVGVAQIDLSTLPRA